MKKYCTLSSLLLLALLNTGLGAEHQASTSWSEPTLEPHAVGFELIEAHDTTRPPAGPIGPEGGVSPRGRTIRIYRWYPAQTSEQKPLKLRDYARMAADDFRPSGAHAHAGGEHNPTRLPVPLAKGLDHDQLEILLDRETAAIRDASPLAGSYSVIVFGQGLYYESPLSHVVLCEHLAAAGYLVATCPLVGTFTRLVNLSVIDLETQIRDLEFVLASARTHPSADPQRLGLIGYDLGGMAALTLCMRNPDVDALLSLDAGILYGHFSTLPQSHPHYDESRFVIPWLHMTQARFVPAAAGANNQPSLFDRKHYGDTYLLPIQTNCHGDFTSYATFGIKRFVPGYWEAASEDAERVHAAISAYALAFFDAFLKDDENARTRLDMDPARSGLTKVLREARCKSGRTRPPFQEELVNQIIERGVATARPAIEKARRTYPGATIIREEVLNWLGYHFLYWWGREFEAIALFALNVELHPRSANVHDSLGEAYSVNGLRQAAIQSYRRSLELDPENDNARQALERLGASR